MHNPDIEWDSHKAEPGTEAQDKRNKSRDGRVTAECSPGRQEQERWVLAMVALLSSSDAAMEYRYELATAVIAAGRWDWLAEVVHPNSGGSCVVL